MLIIIYLIMLNIFFIMHHYDHSIRESCFESCSESCSEASRIVGGMMGDIICRIVPGNPGRGFEYAKALLYPTRGKSAI
jgi:hypothetical protein